MKKILFNILLLFSLLANAQNGDEKRDHIWLLGYTDELPVPPQYGNINFDFNQSPVEITETGGYMDFSETNSSICDRDGNLLFYTNGIYIGRGTGQAMANGNGLSPGLWTDEWKDWGMIMPGGALILPVPESENLYIVLHGLLNVLDNVGPCITNWYYSIVDMSKQNGQGAVVEKNIEFIADTLAVGNLAATRHGNGRDWWLLIPKFNSNIYYRILLTPGGLQTPETQAIGEAVEEGVGQAVFSPDGSKYARNEMIGGAGIADIISLYDFDRCSGLLSNDVHIAYADSAYTGGAAFSPNSRFLYIPHYNNLYQFDTDAPDLLASMDTVAVRDAENSPYGTHFYLASLAPDNKIYINSLSGTQYLHIIHKPDLKGDSCEVEMHGLPLPVWNSSSLPKYPNYRLGALEGSPCDTIETVGTTGAYSFSKIFVYPNPAGEVVFFDNSRAGEIPSRVLFYNNMGEVVFEKKWARNMSEYKMDVSGLAAGIYFYTVYGEERVLKSGKIIVQREY
ncbi:MAG TPA: T9SS type A sorting domain-containing protein [Bacteroidetes bacterium]|nr:T9SS type A sorting domain-containing protein [Bacteroidota bacterium]